MRYKGKVVKTMARPTAKGGMEINIFVELTHDKDGKPLDEAGKTKIEGDLITKNGSGFQYFKGLDRSSFLRYLPCRPMGLRIVRDVARDVQGSAKKARLADDGPAGGSAGPALAP